MNTPLKGIRVATGTSGDDRDELESRTDETAAGADPIEESVESEGSTAVTDESVDADVVEVVEDEAEVEEVEVDDADSETAVAASTKKKQSAAKKGKKTPKRAEAEAKAEREERRGPGKFLQEVMTELKKVVTPTRKELWRYVGVVLSFLIIMMLLVMAFDWVFGFISSWVFGEGTQLFPVGPVEPSVPPTVPATPVPAP